MEGLYEETIKGWFERWYGDSAEKLLEEEGILEENNGLVLEGASAPVDLGKELVVFKVPRPESSERNAAPVMVVYYHGNGKPYLAKCEQAPSHAARGVKISVAQLTQKGLEDVLKTDKVLPYSEAYAFASAFKTNPEETLEKALKGFYGDTFYKPNQR